jgi:hypothetical protein
MYQSAFMVEREVQQRQQKVRQREAELRRLVREAQPSPEPRRSGLSDLYQLTFCALRSLWRMAS